MTIVLPDLRNGRPGEHPGVLEVEREHRELPGLAFDEGARVSLGEDVAQNGKHARILEVLGIAALDVLTPKVALRGPIFAYLRRLGRAGLH